MIKKAVLVSLCFALTVPALCQKADQWIHPGAKDLQLGFFKVPEVESEPAEFQKMKLDLPDKKARVVVNSVGSGLYVYFLAIYKKSGDTWKLKWLQKNGYSWTSAATNLILSDDKKAVIVIDSNGKQFRLSLPKRI